MEEGIFNRTELLIGKETTHSIAISELFYSVWEV